MSDVADSMSRAILHVDMDCFFAAVEALEDPSLRNRPLIVGGDGARGVVASCSYEARSYGIRSAMPSVRAKRLCPHAVFVPGHYGLYQDYSARLMEVLRSFTPLVEPLSLDEAFLDVTGSQRLFGSPLQIGWQIREGVFDALGLDCSVGVANTKHLAKLTSVRAKPKASRNGPVDGAGVFEVKDNEAIEFLHGLPVRAIWGIGQKTADRLAAMGIESVGQLASTSADRLKRVLGEVTALHLIDLAWNRDDREVITDHVAKSVGHEQTYEADLRDRSEVHHQVVRLADAVTARLRKGGKSGRTITLKVRFGDFRTITRSRTLPKASANLQTMVGVVEGLLDDIELASGVRLLGISVSNLGALHESSQLSLDGLISDTSPVHATPLKKAGASYEVDSPENASTRAEAMLSSPTVVETNRMLDEALDLVRARFGEASVVPGQLVSKKTPGSPRLLRHGDQQWGPTKRNV